MSRSTKPEALLWEHLQTARWYAGKGRNGSLAGVVALPWLTRADALPAVRIEIVEVSYPDGSLDYYQVPLCYRDVDSPGDPESLIGRTELPGVGPVELYDGCRDSDAQEILMAVLIGESERTDESGDGTARVTPHLGDDAPIALGLEARVHTGQQSNTSIRYGDEVLLKVFRRLELGRNLDIEIHDALAHTEESVRSRVARLDGWLEAEWQDSSGRTCQADLAILVEQLRDVSDGWDVAVESCRTGSDFTESAASLGEALRAVHRGLAQSFPTGSVAGSELTPAMDARLATAGEEVADLAAYANGLRTLTGRLAELEYPTQRIHGDFHLAQVLLATDADGARSWRIIDFEGEPLKTLEERRTRDSRWRDVAGMLRSFDYAAGFARLQFGAETGSTTEWREAAQRSFIAGYLGHDTMSGDERTILHAYQADKAVYEVLYEARNRPEWLPIPLSALAALAAAGGDAEPGRSRGQENDDRHDDDGGMTHDS